MANKSILFIDQSGEISGGQVALQGLLRVVLSAGRRVAVLAPLGGALEEAIRKQWGSTVELHDAKELKLTSGHKTIRDALALCRYLFYSLRFIRLVRSFDVVCVNGGRLAFPFFLLSLFSSKCQWIYYVRIQHTKFEKVVLAMIARSPVTYQMVMASSFLYQDFVESLPKGFPLSRVRKIEDCLYPPFSELKFEDRFSRRNAPLTVALIGRVAPEKGHDCLPRLARRFPNLHFVMIGSISEENRGFFQRIQNAAPPNLTYHGESRDIPAVIRELPVHISLVPSRWEEAFGLVSIESMACSCLTIVSNRGMLPCIAAKTGAFCFEDEQALIEILKRLEQADNCQLLQLAAGQYEAVRKQFDPAEFHAQLLALIGVPSGQNR